MAKVANGKKKLEKIYDKEEKQDFPQVKKLHNAILKAVDRQKPSVPGLLVHMALIMAMTDNLVEGALGLTGPRKAEDWLAKQARAVGPLLLECSTPLLQAERRELATH